MESQEALTKIVAGVTKFQRDIYPEQRSLFERLHKGQEPLALFITCADSRVVPNLITQTEPGEIFVERNPGNLVPPYGQFVGGVTASVEYAMMVLKVPLVIICGHTDCGVMKALANPQQADRMPGLQQWMHHALMARERLLAERSSASEEDKLRRLTQYNVLKQIDNLRTHPSVATRLAAEEIEIRGWVYDIATGVVLQADPQTGEFQSL